MKTLPPIKQSSESLFVICKDLKNPSKRLLNALSGLRSINTPLGEGYEFNDALYASVAYFFQNIYGRSGDDGVFKRWKASPDDYTIEKIKTFFDNSPLPKLTPVTRLVGEYKHLYEAELFHECYYVINVAYFLSTSFGDHQYFEYLTHYINTGVKLPEASYNYDVDVLEKKYAQIDSKNLELSTEKRLWYYSILDVMLNELDINNPYYSKKIKDGDGRYYNPLTLTARPLRKEQPFLMGLVDISSAYPTAIDKYVGSNIAPSIYENLQSKLNISRAEAKILFNRKLNSGRFRNTPQKKREYFDFLLNCGYTEPQAKTIINELTDDPNMKFYDFAVLVEKQLMEAYKERSSHTWNASRVHDAYYFCLHNDMSYDNVMSDLGGYSFKFEYVNSLKENTSFHYSNRFLKKTGFAFAPKGMNLAYSKTIKEASGSIGRFSGYVDVNRTDFRTSQTSVKSIDVDVEFFKDPEIFMTANFKTYNKDFTPCIMDVDELASIYFKSLNLVQILNPKKKVMDARLLTSLFWHHRQYSNLCFDVQTFVHYFEDMECENVLPLERERDYRFYKDLDIDESDYVIFSAINKARSIVNSKTMISDFMCDLDAFVNRGLPFVLAKYKGELLTYAKQCNKDVFGVTHKKSDKKTLNLKVLYKLSYNTLKISQNLSLSLTKAKHKARIQSISQKLKEAQAQLREQLEREHEIQSTLEKLQSGITPAQFKTMHNHFAYYFKQTTPQEKPAVITPEVMQGSFFDVLRERLQWAKTANQPNATAKAYAWLFCDDDGIHEAKPISRRPKATLQRLDAKNIVRAKFADYEYKRILEWYKQTMNKLALYPDQVKTKVTPELNRLFLEASPYNKEIMKATHIKRMHPSIFEQYYYASAKAS